LDRKAPHLNQDAIAEAPPLRLLLVAARRDPHGVPARILALAREQPALEARHLCGAAGIAPPPGVRIFQPFAEPSFLVEADGGFDAATHSQSEAALLRQLEESLREWAPHIVHMHDLAPFGMEFIGLVRRTLPEARLCVTLSPGLAGRLGITGPSRGFLHDAPLRRFLAEATLLLPCESMLPACIAFGLDPARILTHAPPPPALDPAPLPPLGRFLMVAAFVETAEQAALVSAAAELMVSAAPGLRLDMQAGWKDSPESLSRLTGAHLLLMPDAAGGDPEGLASLALGLGRPVICAARGQVARQIQPGRDGWQVPMNPASLAHVMLDLFAAPDRIADMADSLLPPPSPRESGAALIALYNELLADPARIAPPHRI